MGKVMVRVVGHYGGQGENEIKTKCSKKHQIIY